VVRQLLHLAREGATGARRQRQEFGLEPLGTIASGALLLTLAPSDAATLLHACAREGIACAFIGQVVPKEQGVTLVESGKASPMPVFPQDEIAKLFKEP